MAIRIKIKKAEGEYDLGASKFLGRPTLPDHLEDELDSDTIFFMQIRLSDIAELDKENKLPHKGYLYIFLDTANTEYSLVPIVKYVKSEPTNCINEFNGIVSGYEEFIDDYLIEFEECDDLAEGNKLFGKPNDWNYAEDDRELLLQFDPMDNEMGIFSHLDGYFYFFFGKDRKNYGDIELVEDIS